MTAASAKSDNRIRLMIVAFFFLSGISGLMYEILWTRFLVKIIGGAPFTISIVLTIFMGGLGLGSYLAGRIIDRIENPLRLVRAYGILELIIGGFALIIPVLLIAFRPIYAWLYNALFQYFLLFNILTFIGCAVILAVPVICMGATLPILCRFYVARLSALGTHAGRLYGLNTIGAAVGSLLCGFWLLNFLGNYGTLALAVSINTIIGLACIVAGYSTRAQSKKTRAVSTETGSESASPVYFHRSILIGGLVIFAVSGFCAMACEVIWTKLLSIIVGPTTYSFTIVLVTFISGLALGSIVFGWVADRTGKPLPLLIVSQIAAALLIVLASQLLGNSQLFFAKLITVTQDNFALLSLSKAAILFCIMILPTLCLGATFPLVNKIYTQSLSRIGKSIGTAYAINTIGAVLGAFCGGFILIPFLGKEMGLRLVGGLQLLTAFAVGAIIMIKTKQFGKKWAILFIPVAAGCFVIFYYPSWDRELLARGLYHRTPISTTELSHYGWLETLFHGRDILSRYDRSELVYYGDGAGGITTVMKSPTPIGSEIYVMINSGKVDASSRGDMKTQTLLAHVPMLFHRQAKDVMVVGLASGVTTGEILYYPINRLDILEISREVVEGSTYFRPWNNNTLADNRSHLIIQDGRAHLELTDKTYDVIISEPSNPWMAGMASLFTREFFELARDRLNDDGIFVQFTHSYQMDWFGFSLIGRTFADIFPNSLLIDTDPLTSGYDFILMGSKGGGGLNFQHALNNIQFVEKSPNLRLTDPRQLYRQIRSEDLAYLFGEGPINTDNSALLEFAAPRIMHRTDPQIDYYLQSRQRRLPGTDSIIAAVAEDIDAQIDFVEYALSLFVNSRHMIDLTRVDSVQRETYRHLYDQFCGQYAMNLAFIDEPGARAMCQARQIDILRKTIEETPDKSVAYFHLGSIYAGSGEYAAAAECYEKGLEITPDAAIEHFALAKIYEQAGNPMQAGEHYQHAIDIRPYWAEPQAAYGVLLFRAGSLGLAKNYLAEAIRLDTGDVNTNINLGLLHMQLMEFVDAEERLQSALASRPDFPQVHLIYGKLLSQMNRWAEAIDRLMTAIQLDPNFAQAHLELGLVYIQQKAWNNAATCFQNSLAANPDQPLAHYYLGVALMNTNNLNLAATHFNEALRLNPGFGPAQEGLEQIKRLRNGS